MKKKEFSYNLQLFAEDNPPGGSEGGKEGENKGEPKGTESEQKGEDKPKDDRSTPKYSDDDLDKIIGDRFAKWQKKKEKEIDEAKKLAEMNAQEKAEYERDKLQKELEELKAKDTKSQMTATARKILADEDINISDELLTLLVTSDAESTKTSVDSFAKMYNEAVQKGVKEALKSEPPKKGSSPAGVTKDQIMDIKDPAERRAMIAKHMDLFK